jgi:hypothetical protein
VTPWAALLSRQPPMTAVTRRLSRLHTETMSGREARLGVDAKPIENGTASQFFLVRQRSSGTKSHSAKNEKPLGGLGGEPVKDRLSSSGLSRTVLWQGDSSRYESRQYFPEGSQRIE